MPPVKCTDSNKSVTKILSGIECSKCNKCRHADCAAISNEKFALLANTGCMDWVCRKYNKNSKCLWLILPESPNTPIAEEQTMGKLQIAEMVRSEVTKILRTELEKIRRMQFSSDKVDEYEEKFSPTEEIIKDYKANSPMLSITNHDLELKVSNSWTTNYIDWARTAQRNGRNS